MSRNVKFEVKTAVATHTYEKGDFSVRDGCLIIGHPASPYSAYAPGEWLSCIPREVGKTQDAVEDMD